MIKLKRAYDLAGECDGVCFLVDRLWPRGLKKETLNGVNWLKSVSPSNELRHWFQHDPAKWKEFQRRYFAELDENPEVWQPLLQAAQTGDLTVLFSARDTEHNNAVALKAYLSNKMKSKAAVKRAASRST